MLVLNNLSALKVPIRFYSPCREVLFLMTIQSFGIGVPNNCRINYSILGSDNTLNFMDVGDLPGSLSCPGPFGRAIVWQPCFESTET